MMSRLRRFPLTRATAIRAMADIVMANMAIVSALLLRMSIQLLTHGSGQSVDYGQELREYVTVYWQNAWLVMLVCLVVFTFTGFYSFGRAYQGRYKVLVITQAVLLSYLIMGFVTHILWARLGLIEIPRAALLMACLINLGLTLASRSWTFLWERVVRPEREAGLRQAERPVRSVLVIGGAGYIGSALLPKLLDKGYRIRVLDILLYGSDPIQNVVDHPRLEIVKGDFRDVQTVVQAMRDMDAVVHLGAIVGDPACSLDERLTLDINLSATQMIAQVAKVSGIRRFVFASTCSVYGASDDLLDEHSEVQPISLYGDTKLAAERGLSSMADDLFTPTILRFGTIFGFSGRTRFDLVINLLAAKAKIDGEITVHGGSQWRPFLHVDDAAAAVLAAVRAPLALVGNELFNVGSDKQNYTIGEIGELIKEQVIGAELIVEESTTDNRNYRVSFRKIRNVLDFQCQWSVEDGIRQVLEAVAAGEVDDYRDPIFSNVKFLTESGGIETIRNGDDWDRKSLEKGQSAETVGQ